MESTDRLVPGHRPQLTSADASEVPEIDLIRDIIYVLQGIDGHYVRFDQPDRTLPPALTRAGEAEPGICIATTDGPTQDLLHQLAELGWLFRKIQSGIKRRATSEQRGTVEQSLCHALETELESYFQLLAVLEARAARPITALSDAPDEPPSERLQLSLGLSDTIGLTLKRLAVWTQDARLKLRMMGVLIDGCDTSHGGALVSLLHSYTSHGDPFVRSFTDDLLLQVSQPFFRTLAKWIYEGELIDPFDEFFVQLNPDVKDAVAAAQARQAEAEYMGYSSAVEDASGLRLWERKYLFRAEMLPTFVSSSFAEKIFLTGKSLNFIKSSCGDAAWVAEHQKQHGSGKVLGYGDIAGLERTIDSAYSAASQRLFEIFFGKLRLLDHLRALKDYLLLGRGDFFEVLIEGMACVFLRVDCDLTLMLETAMRASSASATDEEISRRLDARMLEYSNTDIAWDVFTLEYKVDAPVDTVIDASTLDKYLRVFQHLWRMKRVEVSANAAWRRITTDARTFARVSSLDRDFHRARLTLADMVHFVRQMQYFCHLDVIEVNWAKLEVVCSKKEGDLDTLIKAHRQTLRTIRNQALLLQPSKSGREEALLLYVRDAFTLILQFRETVDALCNFALAEASRQVAAGDAERYAGSDSPKLSKTDLDLRDNIRKRLLSTSKRFDDTVLSLISAVSVHPITELRTLAVRLDFGGSRRRQRK